MSIYLSLGSNLGDRPANIRRAIKRLKLAGFRVTACSSLIESPALLPDGADTSWNQPYLNAAVVGETAHSLSKLLHEIKQIEVCMGRLLDAPRWSPRPIDIDILFSDKQTVHTSDLVIPHPGISQRAFVLTPLLQLRPDLIINGNTVLTHSQKVKPIPLWMGIINATPDSFSDGGNLKTRTALHQKLDRWLQAGVHIWDIGAESTRPNAQAISPKEEWLRLAPILRAANEMRGTGLHRPLISVDTRHAETAQRALDCGADWLNDVGGLIDIDMIRLAKSSGVPVIAMHSLSLPAKVGETLNPDICPVEQVLDWLDERRALWQSAGLNLNQIIFDPGIGFGKTALQNISLLRACETLRAQRFRLLIGHSRKSFITSFTDSPPSDASLRDIETLGISLSLCQQGVDIIRCHDPLLHIKAYRAWSQTQAL